MTKAASVHGSKLLKTLDSEVLDALKNDRVADVNVLISKKGFEMENFLTISRLESLYNTDKGPLNTLNYIVRDVTRTNAEYRYNLPDIGLAMEKLMGGSYESYYCSDQFKQKWAVSKLEDQNRKGNVAKFGKTINPTKTTTPISKLHKDFKYPYSDLFIWAVLMKRQEMALYMWQRGEESLTKALVAIRLYTYLSYEASDDFLVQEITEDYLRHAKEFQRLSVELLDRCWRQDRDYTTYLLTNELDCWGGQTNLSLAVIAHHEKFLAHTSCQWSLSDLWLGGLRIRRYATIKILLGLAIPAFILTLNFKTKSELAMQPQRADELDGERGDSTSTRFDSSFGEQGLKGKFGSLHISPNVSLKEKSFSVEAVKCPTMPPLTVHKTTGQQIASTYQTKHAFNTVERPLNPMKKFYEFYVAPQTTFWIWTIAYFAFLMCFTYTVLTKIRMRPSRPEFYIMSYVVTFTIEIIRRIIISEGRNFGLRITLYFNQPWTKMYAMAILFFYMAMSLRFTEGMLEYGRLCYACDIVFWYWLLLDLFSVNFQIGVYVSMMKKMIIGTFQVLSILSVVLVSFGVVRQSIKHPNEEWSWDIARQVLYKPYFMLYGEVYTEEVDPCNDFGKDCDITGHFITPVYMAVFMMVSNILIINLMIAVFNHIFTDINAISQEVWRFYRYWVVLDYEYKPFSPPPFIIIYHLFFIIKLLVHRKKHGRWFEFAMKLILNGDNVSHVHEFERCCLKAMQENKDINKSASVGDTIKRTSHDVKALSNLLKSLNDKFQTFEQQQAEIVKILKR